MNNFWQSFFVKNAESSAALVVDLRNLIIDIGGKNFSLWQEGMQKLSTGEIMRPEQIIDNFNKYNIQSIENLEVVSAEISKAIEKLKQRQVAILIELSDALKNNKNI